MSQQQRTTAVIVFSSSQNQQLPKSTGHLTSSTSINQNGHVISLPTSPPSSSPRRSHVTIQVPFISPALTITPCGGPSNEYLDPFPPQQIVIQETPSSPIPTSSEDNRPAILVDNHWVHLSPVSPERGVDQYCLTSSPFVGRSDEGLDHQPSEFGSVAHISRQDASCRSGDQSRDSSIKRGRPRLDDITSLIQEATASPSDIRCTFCHRVFPREKSLQAHLRTHTGERPYSCDFPGCGRAFAQSGQLRTHQRLHTGEKPFICAEEGCEMRFTHANRHCSLHPGAGIKRDKSITTPRSEQSILQVNSSLSNDANRTAGRNAGRKRSANCTRLRTRRLFQEQEDCQNLSQSSEASGGVSQGENEENVDMTVWKKKKAALELQKKQMQQEREPVALTTSQQPVKSEETPNVPKDQLLGALALIELSRSHPGTPEAVLSNHNSAILNKTSQVKTC